MKPKIGIDIIENQRLKLEPDFLKRFLTADEIKMLDKFSTSERKIQFSAGRWAVKEAIFKVLDHEKKLTLNQIDIKYDQDGALQIINPELADISISISHEKSYSVGVALKLGV